MSVDVTQRPAAQYGFSALLKAIPTMGRATAPALALIVVNAIVQSLLMYLNAPSGFSAGFLVSFAISTASALALYGVLASGALEAVDGTASWASVLGRAIRNAAPFTLWVALQWVAIVAVSLIHPALIALVAVLTPFLPLAAMDGRANAIVCNFQAMGSRFGRWLLTTLVLLVAGAVLFLLTVANTLFVKGTPASAIFWLVIGVVAWWVLTAWALLYRSTPVGAPGR